jgi:uncharacterized membrane protein YgdD (TMEM256/DUF423 family)
MKPLSRFAAVLLALAGFAGATGVGMWALAAHGVAQMSPKGEHAVVLFERATAFQLMHALALMLVTLLAEGRSGATLCALRTSAVLFAAATVLFPTALYSSAFGGPVFWAPWGGTMAIIGWLALTVGAVLAARTKA